MSSKTVFQPELILSAVSASEGSTPMAVSTAERLTLPDEQAAPALTQTPARSRAMTCVSALTPGMEMQVVFESRCASAP
jgi:hypothetical protein